MRQKVDNVRRRVSARSASLPTSELVSRRGETPLGSTLFRRWRYLCAAFLTVTAAMVGIDWLLGVEASRVVVGSGGVRAVPVGRSDPMTTWLLRLERATLVALVAVVVLIPFLAARDRPEVRLRRGLWPFGGSLLAALAGVAVGAVVGVDAVHAVFETGLVYTGTTGGPHWLAELALGVPATLGVAAALPGGVVGAVRSGLVGRRTTTRQRWLAVLVLLSFVAFYSPSDAVTFVLGGTAVLAGLLAGLALVEYDVVTV